MINLTLFYLEKILKFNTDMFNTIILLKQKYRYFSFNRYGYKYNDDNNLDNEEIYEKLFDIMWRF